MADLVILMTKPPRLLGSGLMNAGTVLGGASKLIRLSLSGILPNEMDMHYLRVRLWTSTSQAELRQPQTKNIPLHYLCMSPFSHLKKKNIETQFQMRVEMENTIHENSSFLLQWSKPHHTFQVGPEPYFSAHTQSQLQYRITLNKSLQNEQNQN